jgi:HSP20 family protein
VIDINKRKKPETEIDFFRLFINPMSNDDIEHQILSPLSCLREFHSKWILEFDLPLVDKKDISVSVDPEYTITVEAKLKETYSETRLGYKSEFKYFKKSVTLPGKFNEKKIVAKFENGRLTISVPKLSTGNKIKVE